MMPNKPQPANPGQFSKPSQMPPRKVYNRDFKLETLRLLKSSGKTKADLERELVNVGHEGECCITQTEGARTPLKITMCCSIGCSMLTRCR